MKFLIYFLLVILSASCASSNENSKSIKSDNIAYEAKQPKIKPEICDFQKGKYNKTLRIKKDKQVKLSGRLKPNEDSDGDGIVNSKDNCPTSYNPAQEDWNNNKIGDACDLAKPPINDAPPSSTSFVLYFDFYGESVNSVYWNSGMPFVCDSSGMSEAEILLMIEEIRKDYASFSRFRITANEAEYLAAPINQRQKIVVTQTSSWYGAAAGGVAYVGSLKWNVDVPGFVFSNLLGYSQRKIWEACSHEAGHTIGLNHQSRYDAACNMTEAYNSGNALTAPIMGNSYEAAQGVWWVGPSNLGCNSIQKDSVFIRSIK